MHCSWHLVQRAHMNRQRLAHMQTQKLGFHRATQGGYSFKNPQRTAQSKRWPVSWIRCQELFPNSSLYVGLNTRLATQRTAKTVKHHPFSAFADLTCGSSRLGKVVQAFTYPSNIFHFLLGVPTAFTGQMGIWVLSG